ncbi:MAG: hypothetical protein R3B98_03805 [Hyphomonas sp.]
MTERGEIADRLVNGLADPAPERKPLPDVSLDDGEIGKQDI